MIKLYRYILRIAGKYLDIKGDDGWAHRFYNTRFKLRDNTNKLWTYIIKN